MSEKLLTICLPTYNRCKFITNQLNFLSKEIEAEPSILKNVRFIVANNASTDNTKVVLDQAHAENPFFEIVHNTKNLGLVGNITFLRDLCQTDYVWFVSDDDVLKKGILSEILYILNVYNDLEFLFLNFSHHNKKVFNGKVGHLIDGKKSALEVYNEMYGSLVFMTACVYKRKNLLKIASNPMSNWLAGPLFYSLYSCSKGNIYITDKEWVIFTPNNGSYDNLKTVLKLKFEEYVPILESMTNFGYNDYEIKRTIKNFFLKQSHAHFLYNFINLKKSLKYYKYYTLKTVINFPKNLLSIIK